MEPTLRGIQGENMNFKGIIFFGIMITQRGVYLLEYNVRMGDPETQAILPLMESDLVELVESTLDGSLSEFKVRWKEGNSCCVVAASGGYPGSYKTGYVINGLQKIKGKAFISGVDTLGENLITAGGRVLSVCSTGNTLQEARQAAYEDMKNIGFEGMNYRRDIGKV